jgi:exonuclease VII large subunit
MRTPASATGTLIMTRDVLQQAEAVARTASRAALRVALQEHGDALATLQDALRFHRPESPVVQTALRQVEAARRQLEASWQLHFHRPLR